MKKKTSEALGEERLGWKEGQKDEWAVEKTNEPSKDEWAVKRRMDNQIARLIDEEFILPLDR